MNIRSKVSGRISKPVHDVFEAVADPAQLSHYFTTGGAEGRLGTNPICIAVPGPTAETPFILDMATSKVA